VSHPTHITSYFATIFTGYYSPTNSVKALTNKIVCRRFCSSVL